MADTSWFDSLTQSGVLEDYSWLKYLPLPIERIVNFGCWRGSEPFALLWICSAREITVVEKELAHLEMFRDEIRKVRAMCPAGIQDRSVCLICQDMSEFIPELSDESSDLAFCQDVLYNLQNDEGRLRDAIAQMVRTVKPGGLVVAVEPKFGVEYEDRKVDLGIGRPIIMPVPQTAAKDMSILFVSQGLKKLTISGSPVGAYCYQRTKVS